MAIGLLITAWAVAGALTMLSMAAGAEVGPKAAVAWVAAAVFAVAAAVFGYWTFALATLRYQVDDRDVVIRWGPYRVFVPIMDIQRMVPGRTAGQVRLRGVRWWGCGIGRADVDRIGTTRFFATEQRPQDLLYLVTPHGSYALTIPNHARFVEAVRQRAVTRPREVLGQRTERAALARLSLRRDRLFLASSAIAIVACVALVGYVFTRYDGLADIVRLDFPTREAVVRVGDRERLLWIPALGAAAVIINLALGTVVHAGERAAALWLVASASIIQLVLIAAAVMALSAA